MAKYIVGDAVDCSHEICEGKGRVIDITENINGETCYMIQFDTVVEKVHPKYLTKISDSGTCICTSLLGLRDPSCPYGSHNLG